MAQPGNARAWCYLGYLMDKQGDTESAERHLLKALAIQPEYLDALNCLGNAYMTGEDFKKAEESFARALSIQPDHAGILNNKGRALKALGKKELAGKYFRRAVEISPSYVPALINLGQQLHEAMKYEDSLQCFKSALARSPEDPEIYCQIGMVCKNTGKYEEALSAFNKALDIRPGMTGALGGIAAVLVAQGKNDECYELIEALPEHQREDPVITMVYSGLCRRHDKCEGALRLINKVLSKSGIDSWSRLQLNFGAGHICDGMGKYSEAFDYYAKGNRGKICHYRPDVIEKLFSDSIHFFTGGYLEKVPVPFNASDKPVFIVGMPRSGTTLVEQILASHSDVYGAGELPDMGELYSRFIRKYMPDNKIEVIGAVEQDVLDMASNEYLSKINGLAPNSLRVTDKMPYNFFRLGFIQMLFPGARVIHCYRDPMDVCLSCYFHDFQGTHEYAYDLSNLAHYYGQYERQMQHWRDVITLPFLEVSYESVVEDTESIARALVEFCGLGWDDKCLSFYENKRYVATASKNQVNKPVYSTSVNRWKNYEGYLDELKEALMENGVYTN